MPLIGASAGIYGILVGVAVTAPAMMVRLLFPPITLTMRQLAMVALGISGVMVLFRIGGNAGGEAGHLGGAISGFLMMRGWMWWQGREVGAGAGPRVRREIGAKIRPRTSVDFHGQGEVDAILDKISKHGFQSISAGEREVLERAARREQERK